MGMGLRATIVGAMNKAFTRDPEPRDPCCPEPEGCGSLGTPVDRETLRAQLTEAAAEKLQGGAYYCPNPACEIAYYDAWGATVSVSALACPAWPKPPSAPLCACLGITAADIIEDARRGDRDRIRAVVDASQSDPARCAGRMPSGRSCATEARRLFLAHFKPQ